MARISKSQRLLGCGLFFALSGWTTAQSLDIETAVEIKVPTEVGYTYDLRSGEDLNTLVPLGKPFAGTGSTVSVFFPIDSDAKFFDAVVSVGGTATLLPGLSSFNTETARLEFDGAAVSMAGVRVEADGVDADDFVRARYALDFSSQSLTPTEVGVVKNVGPTFLLRNSFYPLIDVSSESTVSRDGASIPANTAVFFTIPPEGVEINVAGSNGQMFGFEFQATAPFNLEVESDLRGAQIVSISDPATVWRFSEAFLGDGQKRIRISPAGTDAIECGFAHYNLNATPTSTSVVNGSSISPDLGSNGGSYRKYLLNIAEGQDVAISGSLTNGGVFLLTDLRGRHIGPPLELTGSGSGLSHIFNRVPESGTYYLIFWNDCSYLI